MTGSSEDVLAAFVADLAGVRAACGSPSLSDLVAHSADLPYPLARSTISDKLNGRSLPGWEFVLSFVTACRAFAEAVGATPPPHLVDLVHWDERHLRLLRDLDPIRRDERLATAAGNALQARATASSRPVPRALPPAVRPLVGRAEEVRLLSRLADEADRSGSVVIAAIHGTAGVGKTALAVHAAHLLADRFPDGQLYVNLRGFDPGGHIVSSAAAVRGFLEALSVPSDQVPPSESGQADLYRSRLADRRMLVLLDNARDAEHVRPLLPASGSLVMVTSRDRLTGLIARDGAHSVPLDLLTEAQAEQLITGRLGADRVEGEAAAVHEIVARCARLPLALSIVAARASARPATPLAALARGLRAVPDALDILDTTDAATGVRQTLSWSYRLLTEAAASLFRDLALHPGPDVSIAAAGSLAGWPQRQTRAALDELVEVHLIDELRPDRFGFHDLLRAYAAELSETVDAPAERAAAVRRLLDHYVHTGHAAAVALEPMRPRIGLDAAEPGVTVDGPSDQAAAQQWFAAEWPALLGLVEFAAQEGFDRHCWQLAWTMIDFLHRSGRSQDCVRSLETALAAATRLDDGHAVARIHRAMGLALVRTGRLDEAVRHSRRAVALHRALADRAGQGHAHLNLGGMAMMRAAGAATDAERRGGQRAALRHAGRAADLFRLAGERAPEAQALGNMGWVYSQVGEHRRAIEVCERSIALLNEVGAPSHAQADTLDTLGHAYYHSGEHVEAEVRYRQALDGFVARGDRHAEAETLTHLAEDRLDAGDRAGAHAAWDLAVEILLEVDPASADSLMGRLATFAAQSQGV